MGLFSGKKEERNYLSSQETQNETPDNILGEKDKKMSSKTGKFGEKIPRILPDTLMQKLSLSKSPSTIIPRKIYTDDIKASMQIKEVKEAKDEHKRIPLSFISQQSGEKGPEKQEIEKVIMLKKELEDAQQEVRSADLPSFFLELEKKLFEKGIDRKHIVSQDILARLKEYHDSLNKGNSFFLHEIEIEEEIAKSLSSLKEIESEWLTTKRNVSIAEKMLYDKESELEKRLGSFKELLSTAEKFRLFNMVAEENKSFFLVDGTKISSIQGLLQEIPRMKDDVFFFHVTPEKNDFATWIQHVFGLEDLASRINSAKTKMDILEVLRNY